MWAPCPHFELFRTGWGYPQGCPHVLSRVFNIPSTCFVLENAGQVVSKSRQGARNHEHRFSRHGQRPAFFWCCPHVSGRLHMQALNCLSRSKAMLTANEPMYGFALPQPSRLLQRCNPLLCRWGAVSHASHPKTRCRRDNAGRATPRIYPLRTTPIGHSADPHSRLTNRKARRLVNEVEAHGLAWTYMDNKKALSIYLLRAF